MRQMLVLVLFVLVLFINASLLQGQERYVVSTHTQLLTLSYNIALAQVGVKEFGNNDGRMIRVYLRSVGLGAGHPWCMAGQYYCYEQASKVLGIENPLLRTGSTYKQWTYLKDKGKQTQYLPNVHDFIFWRRAGILGHVERIIKLDRNGIVYTIGFNTGGADERDGDGVYIKRRSTLHPLGRLQIRGLIGFEGERQ